MKLLTSIAAVILIILLCAVAVLYVFPFIKNSEKAVPHENTAPKNVSRETASPPVEDSAVVSSDRPERFVAEEPELPLFMFGSLLSGAEDSCGQAVVVLADFSEGNLWCVEKNDGLWYTAAGPLYCRLGKNGISENKTEGDYKTPLGFTEIQNAYLNNNISTKMPVTLLSASAVWVTDSDSMYYNKLVNTTMSQKDYKTAKPMTGGDQAAYVDIGYNAQCRKDAGSAIFLQAAPRLSIPTDGGISLTFNDMHRVLEWLDPEKNPVCGVVRSESVSWTVVPAMDGSFEYISDGLLFVKEDLIFAKDNNALGRPLDGYSGLRAVVSREISEALLEVEKGLYSKGYGLIIYDGYMPARALEGIAKWARLTDDQALKRQYYPDIDKSEILDIFINEFEQHTYGKAVDVGLYRLSDGLVLDMGTDAGGFYMSDGVSCENITESQRENRELLRGWMEWGGFEASEKQWQHFTLKSNAARSSAYNFLIVQ